ncbi:hypothetical protein GWI33_002842 [Rhynchophorus ferrugineus]|uniref:Uncharacterized protein n=1 Tax=Rhynchophorus ferrugineus TaxID=354439 RepID=A0A834IZI5_RHYFE|nr:hypothetical protein GWI33_002842 [Rhynchophorus ferrugineus]
MAISVNGRETSRHCCEWRGVEDETGRDEKGRDVATTLLRSTKWGAGRTTVGAEVPERSTRVREGRAHKPPGVSSSPIQSSIERPASRRVFSD